MILQDARSRPGGGGSDITLDQLFHRAAVRSPDAIALVDPPDREHVTDGAPCRLTYAEADRAVAALAGRLRRIGLATDAIVGLQIANTVESVLALLAVLRAGLIAMPMPLLWRRADASAALNRVGAHALIVSRRINDTDHCALAMAVAADVFTIRHVCGFGDGVPDGVIPLDDLTAAHQPAPDDQTAPQSMTQPGRGAHLALITWDVSTAGLVPVARSHAELIAGGLAVQIESRIEQRARVHTTLTMSSFANLASAVLPWLLVGGTLALHHPFNPDAYAVQTAATPCDTVVVPGPLVLHLAQAGLLTARHGVKRVLGVWHAPERLARAPGWRDDGIALIDIAAFGEAGLIANHRGRDGRVAALPLGLVRVPHDGKNPTVVGEITVTPGGTLAMRGPMVPGAAFPPGAERTDLPHVACAADGFVDTRYACRVDRNAATVVVTAAPPGLIGVGGYRFVAHELQEQMSRAAADGALAVLPDALAGQRLAANPRDRKTARQVLQQEGANPLLIAAFRDRIVR